MSTIRIIHIVLACFALCVFGSSTTEVVSNSIADGELPQDVVTPYAPEGVQYRLLLDSISDSCYFPPIYQQQLDNSDKLLSMIFYCMGEQFRTTEASREDGLLAIRFYTASAALNAGMGSAASYGTIATMLEQGWDGLSDIVHLEPMARIGTLSIDTLVPIPLRHTWEKLKSSVLPSPLLSFWGQNKSLLSKNFPLATFFWEQSANLGNATAHFTMGVLRAHGLFGTRKDIGRSIAHYTMASHSISSDQVARNRSGNGKHMVSTAILDTGENGNRPQSDIRFALAEVNGRSVNTVRKRIPKINDQFASTYFQGHGAAAFALSYKNKNGYDVPLNCTRSVEHLIDISKYSATIWAETFGLTDLESSLGPDKDLLTFDLLESYEQGIGARSTDPFMNIVGMYGGGLPLEDKYKDKKVKSNPIMFYSAAAEKGDSKAHLALGMMYLHGAMGAYQDFQVALNHFHYASEKGDIMALAQLGFMYSNGLGTEQDLEVAQELLQEAYDKGNIIAANTLALILMFNPKATPEDITRAVELFEFAGKGGIPDGNYNLGLLHLKGQHVPRDFKKAIQLLNAASSQGHIPATYLLGVLTYHGIGNPANCKQAYLQLEKAARRLILSPFHHNAWIKLSHGNMDGALLDFVRLAEMGFTNSIWNSAFLLASKIPPSASITSAERDKLIRSFFLAQDSYLSSSAGKKSEEATTTVLDPKFLEAIENQFPDQTLALNSLIRSNHKLRYIFSAESEHSYAILSALAPEDLNVLESLKEYEEHTFSGKNANEVESVVSMEEAKEELSLTNKLIDWVRNILLPFQWLDGDKARDSTFLSMALPLLTKSSTLGMHNANLIIGDIEYYGLVDGEPNFTGSINKYKAACGKNIPQACYNLGWMYEYGIGITRDDHLAKRYYDQANSIIRANPAHKASTIPVDIALFRLRNNKQTWSYYQTYMAQICERIFGKSACDQTVSLLIGPNTLETTQEVSQSDKSPEKHSGSPKIQVDETSVTLEAVPKSPRERLEESIRRNREELSKRRKGYVASLIQAITNTFAAVKTAIFELPSKLLSFSSTSLSDHVFLVTVFACFLGSILFVLSFRGN